MLKHYIISIFFLQEQISFFFLIFHFIFKEHQKLFHFPFS